MPLVVELIEGPSEAVIVELVWRDVPEQIGTTVLGPVGDVDQGQGLTEACGHEEAEDGPAGEFSLGIRGEVPVNDVSDPHLLQQRSDEGQGSEVTTIVTCGRAEPLEGHERNPWLRPEECQDQDPHLLLQ